MTTLTTPETTRSAKQGASFSGLLVPAASQLETHAVLKSCIESRAALAGFIGTLGGLRQRASFANGSVLLDAVGALQLSGKPEPVQRRLLIDPHTDDDLAGCYVAGIESVLRDSDVFISTDSTKLLATRLYQGEPQLRQQDLSARERVGLTKTIQPTNARDIPDEFARWPTYIARQCATLDPLLRMAVAQITWSMMRPLERGNILVQQAWSHVLLKESEICPTPCLPLAYQLNLQAEEYWTLQRHLIETNNWEPYLLFILRCVKEAAEERQRAAFAWQKAVDMLALELEQTFSLPVAAGVVKLACQRSLSVADLIKSSVVERAAAQTFVRELVSMGAFAELETSIGKRFVHQPLINALLPEA